MGRLAHGCRAGSGGSWPKAPRRVSDEPCGGAVHFNTGPARKGVNSLLNLIQALMTRLHKREEGQTIVEYGLVIGGISLVLITLFVTTGLETAFADLVTAISDALTPCTGRWGRCAARAAAHRSGPACHSDQRPPTLARHPRTSARPEAAASSEPARPRARP